MLNLKSFLVLALLALSATSRLISHDVQALDFPSKGKNTLNLDIVDDSTLDIHYQTECEDCKCFIDNASLTPKQLAGFDWSVNGLVDNSFIDGSRVYITHQLKTTDVSYSIIDVQADGSLEKTVENNAIPALQGVELIRFSHEKKAFIALIENALFVYIVDDQGNLSDQKLDISPKIQGKVFDIAYAGNVLFIAKGDLGIELIDFDNKMTGRVVLPIRDLELKENSKITAFEVNPKEKILYAYNNAAEDDDSVADFILALDYSTKPDISIKNNYHHDALKQTIKVVYNSNGLQVINKNDEKYYFMQFSTMSQDNYGNLDLTEIWRMPVKVNNINANKDSILIEGDDYFYVMKKNPSYEARMPALLISIIEKTEESGVFFPLFQGNLFAIIKVDTRDMAILDIKKESKPTLRCGNFKPEYQEKVLFNIYVYKDSCPELQKTAGVDDICLYRYNANIDFTGNDDSQFKAKPFMPQFLETSNWQQEIDSDLVDWHPPVIPEEPEPEEPRKGPEPKEEEPGKAEEPEPGKEPEEPGKGPGPKEEEPAGKGPEPKGEELGKGHEPGKETKPGENPQDPNTTPDPHRPWLHPDDLGHRDTAKSFLNDVLENKYLIIVSGVIILILFALFIRCIINISKENDEEEVAEPYKHKELPEEHEDLEEGPDAASEYETKVASMQSV